LGGVITVDNPKEYEAYENGETEDYEARLYIGQDAPDYWQGKKLNKTYENEKALREAIKDLEAELAQRTVLDTHNNRTTVEHNNNERKQNGIHTLLG
jgi:hypothetical protein